VVHYREIIKKFSDQPSVNITGRLKQINDKTGITSQSYDKDCMTNNSASVPQHRTSYMHLKGKGEVFPVHAMRAYRGSRGIAPLILNLSTRWR
jgi:hypothetical protein